MLNITDLTTTTGAVGTAITGGIGWVVYEVKAIAKFIKEHEIVNKGKELVEAVFWIRDHLKSNQAVQQATQLVEQAATVDADDLRKANIAAALHLLPQAIGVELHSLNVAVIAPVLAKLLNDHMPTLGGNITDEEVVAALQFGENELATLRNHDLLPTIRKVLACIEAPVKPQHANDGTLTQQNDDTLVLQDTEGSTPTQ